MSAPDNSQYSRGFGHPQGVPLQEFPIQKILNLMTLSWVGVSCRGQNLLKKPEEIPNLMTLPWAEEVGAHWGWNRGRTRYRDRFKSLIAELPHYNPILQKIKNGEAVNSDEANQRVELLHEEHRVVWDIFKAQLKSTFNFKRFSISLSICGTF